ncbi:hypothetical protein [Actinoplanes regularis]|uniref:hypothetical protein n=1 Tax=Actinoplanes regularis TaxID=52697 RepID=UPI0024A5530A|nr:hypothetical protein [Actinoplanes regularis]GLW33466.1 hypothetical protein Areg01_64040 [Actinoplanes regularis]
MRTSHVAPAAALLALSLILAVPAMAAPAADTAPPQLHSITFDRSSVAVSGLQTQFVGVRVRLTDETGVQPIDYQAGQELASPYLRFNASLNSFVLLRLAEGTAQDGIWTGSIPVTSAWSGKIEPVGIYAMDQTLTPANTLNVDPRTVVDTPGIQVQSSHRPMIDMTFSPEPLPKGKPVVQKIRAWDATTGKPWPNLSFKLSMDNGCVEPGSVWTARTGANGTYQRTLSAANAQWLQCAWVPGVNQPTMPEPPTKIASDGGHVRTERYSVNATPAAKSVKAGTNVNINGGIKPNYVKGKLVQLQRLYADKTWRKVGTATVRASGRFTLVATPPGRATYSYRVYAPGDYAVVGGLSKVFTIRGT